MIPELGQFCLCLAMLTAVLQACVPLMQRRVAPHPLLAWVRPLATVQFMLVSSAFAALFYAYIVSDFSVMNVVLNSHTQKPLLYKIVGVWGNHEGSMMLWAWILAAYGFALAFLRTPQRELTCLTLSVMGAISAGLLAFILFTSNPFLRIWPIPAEGQDLNPLLQDIGLSFHPPTLYVGYVGFAVVFCFAIAGLLRSTIDRDWARTVQPFILLPWATLTLGIGAGSWWAYRELGWGGWWFWDPVENVSLLPWLIGTALLHANIVLARRGQLAHWVALLAILAFAMSLIGTFIVRSGLITSVHAFASDPARGMFILAYIAIITCGALALYAIKPLEATVPVRLNSRSGLILIGNAILTVAAFTILIAILYPVFLQLADAPSVSVGAPYFNATFLPLGGLLAVLAALGPLLPWDRFTAAQLRARSVALLPAVLAAVLLALALADTQWALACVGMGVGFWLLLASMAAWRRAWRARQLFTSARGWRQCASVLAHAGIAVLALGITATSLFKHTYEAPLVANRPLVFDQYTLRLTQAVRKSVDNYTTRRATFDVLYRGKKLTSLSPELRYYAARDTQTTEAALYSTPLRDIYLVIGDIAGQQDTGGKAIGVRMYVTPGQQWIWLACLMIGGGGFMALAGAWVQRNRGGTA